MITSRYVTLHDIELILDNEQKREGGYRHATPFRLFEGNPVGRRPRAGSDGSTMPA